MSSPSPTVAEPAPLTARGRATRDRILEAAAALMYADGVAATSMDDVKARAGVSSSQLYHYFADRDALISAVVDRQAELVLGAQETLLSGLEDLAALRAWRDAVLAAVAETGPSGGCPVGSLVGELAETNPEHRARLATAFARWQASLAGGLEDLRDRGVLAADADPEALAVGLLAALQGGLLLAQVHRDPAPLAVALDHAIAQVSRATRRGAAESPPAVRAEPSSPGR